MEISYILAFTTGLISFLAPCVLPLLPAYVSMVTGVSLAELQQHNNSKTFYKAILHKSILFMIGFSTVFVLMGLTASGFGKYLVQNRTLLSQIGGIGVIAFGVITLIPQAHTKIAALLHMQLTADTPKTGFGPILLGVTFALAWTPCVGAILGGILTLAATTGSVIQGTLLLLTYSLGISLPFLLLSMTLGTTYPLLKSLGPHLETISKIGGVLLIITGLLLLMNQFNELGKVLLQQFSSHQWYMELVKQL